MLISILTGVSILTAVSILTVVYPKVVLTVVFILTVVYILTVVLLAFLIVVNNTVHIFILMRREKIQGSLVVRKQLLWEKLKIRTLKKYRFSSKIKLHPPIETVWLLNFRASTPMLYVKNKMAEASVKNKMAEASLLPPKEGKKFFLGHSRVFLLDF